jgi:hypothetical protein
MLKFDGNWKDGNLLTYGPKKGNIIKIPIKKIILGLILISQCITRLM